MPKFWITKSRYIGGQYVHASPEFPAEIDLPEGTKVDGGLHPIEEKPERPTPHFAKGGTSAADVFGVKADAGKKGGRPSDRSI